MRIPPSTESENPRNPMDPDKIQKFFDDFGRMPDRDRIHLRLLLDALLFGTHYTSSDDLMHEAIHRILSGQRTWPDGVAIVALLYNACRSLAHAARISAENRTSVDVDPQMLIGSDSETRHRSRTPTVESAEETAISRERLRVCDAAASSIRQKMRDDPIGLLVFAGVLADMTPVEMCVIYQLKQSAIKAARQRVHTHIKAWRRDHSDAI